LSVETLVRDSVAVIKYVAGIYPDASIIIVGHSMGGAIATKAAA
jgi:alpha-beta hydrolase superfamily lysophospholipase